MKHIFLAFGLAFCTPGTLGSEPVSDLQAFHAAWVMAQNGKSKGDATMIKGALDVFARIAPGTSPRDSQLVALWDTQLNELVTEARFLSRGSNNTRILPEPDLFLPALWFELAPGRPIELTMPGAGSRAVLSMGDEPIVISISNATGDTLCSITGTALYCHTDENQDAVLMLSNANAQSTQVILLGNPH